MVIMEHLILFLMCLHFAKNICCYFCLLLTLEEVGNECCTNPRWLCNCTLRPPAVGNLTGWLVSAAVLWIPLHIHAGAVLPTGHSQPLAEPSRVTNTDPILWDRGPLYGRFWLEGSQSAWMQTSLQLGCSLRLFLSTHQSTFLLSFPGITPPSWSEGSPHLLQLPACTFALPGISLTNFLYV